MPVTLGCPKCKKETEHNLRHVGFGKHVYGCLVCLVVRLVGG